MKKEIKKRKWRFIIRWICWVLFVQFLLINISAALYAWKFTHLYTADIKDQGAPPSKNIFAKTWRLFSGTSFFKLPEADQPVFSYTTVHFTTKNNTSIEAWYGQPDSASRGTVILFHGLMGNKAIVLQQAYEFRYWGYNVMLVDNRSHGHSSGSATTIGFRESEEVKLAYDYVKGLGEKKIFLWGTSMGAVEIIKAVGEDELKPAGIILEMPFLSLQSHIKSRVSAIGFPKQPFGFFITAWIGLERGFNALNFNVSHYARHITCPVLMQHGSRDQLAPLQEAEEIYNAIGSADKKLVIYEGANHESFLQRNAGLWREEVGNFLKGRH
jgi:alpha-beta hydrolase superfamily lysophospholipase